MQPGRKWFGKGKPTLQAETDANPQHVLYPWRVFEA